MNRWVSISEAEKILELSRRTIWRKIESGDLESRSQEGKRFVLIKGDEGEEPQAEPRPPEEVRKVKAEVRLPTLTLMELLFELKTRIRDRTQVGVDVARINSSFSNGEEHQETASQWIKILSLLEGTFGRIQKSDLDRRELQDLFAKFLKARANVEDLEQERIIEQERIVHEMRAAASPDDAQAIEEEKRDMDKDMDLFDQCINTIKKLIVMTQGVEE
jgi:hypothetical protein